MSARTLSESSALLLKAELPRGTTIHKTNGLIPGDHPLSRKHGGTIGWFDSQGKPAMCHRRNNRWYGSDEDVARLGTTGGGFQPLVTAEASISSPMPGLGGQFADEAGDLQRRFPALAGMHSD